MLFWVEQFSKKYTGLNVFSFDLNNTGAKDKFTNDLKNALQVNSLFGMNKLVIFRNFLATNAKLTAEVKELLVSSIKQVSEGFFVVFYQTEKPDSRGVVYKQIKALEKKKIAEVKEYKLPREQDLVKWILKKGKKYKANLAPEAVSLLAAMIGNDLWQLDREIHKLANYKKDEKITVEDINLMVKGKYNDDIFQLMDAISAKNKAKILKLYEDQINTGASEMYILSMLIRQFRIFWQIKELHEQGIPTPEMMAKELKMHPYVIKKSLRYVRSFSIAQIKNIYQKLLNIEIQIKTSNRNFDLMFDLLVAEL